MDILNYLFNINNIAFTVPLAGFGTDTYAVSVLELWATITGLICVIGARMNKVWNYPFSLVNCLGFVAIFYQIQLYSDLLLNAYFIGMSLYGWYIWSRKNEQGQDTYKIRFMDTVHAGLLVVGIGVGTAVLGSTIDTIFTAMGSLVAYVLGTEYTHYPASYPYWDAFTTSASLAAMYLMARRYVESWVLWTIVNVVCVALYFHKGVIAMSAEYLVFLANSAYGLYQWNKEAKRG
ncbi:PnuC-like nicotinamide mononucleotide transport [Vibrio phage D51]